MAAPARILVVEDQKSHAEILAELLRREGYDVAVATSFESGHEQLQRHTFDLVITDLYLGGHRGTEVLEEAQARHPGTIVMVVSGVGSIEDAVEAMHMGAAHYFTKPLKADEIRSVVAKALGRRRSPGADDAGGTGFEGLIGSSPSMQQVYETICQVAPTSATILIEGEPGTGKELVAKAIHALSTRRDGPFVALNCGALSEGILESELFGHEKGAFTGASRAREGKFEYADKGTLFLDEVGDMPLSLQVKLLRVVQEREIVRLGSNQVIKVDVRLIAATNRDLEAEVRQGNFREDLYWRLRVVSIPLPPLRERREDIPMIAEHFRAEFAARHEREITGFTPRCLEILSSQPWPGNVRQLQNAVEAMVLLARGPTIDVDDLPPDVRQAQASPSTALVSAEALAGLTLDQWERKLIRMQLERCQGNRARVAKALGISERTLYRKLREYGLS